MSEWIVILVVYLALQCLYACYEAWADNGISTKGLAWAIPFALITFFAIALPVLILNGLAAWLFVNPYYEEVWDGVFWVAGIIALIVFLAFWAYGQTREYDETMRQMRRNIHK